MPVRSSVYAYSPTSVASSGKLVGSVLTAPGSLSIGHYRPLVATPTLSAIGSGGLNKHQSRNSLSSPTSSSINLTLSSLSLTSSSSSSSNSAASNSSSSYLSSPRPRYGSNQFAYSTISSNSSVSSTGSSIYGTSSRRRVAPTTPTTTSSTLSRALDVSSYPATSSSYSSANRRPSYGSTPSSATSSVSSSSLRNPLGSTSSGYRSGYRSLASQDTRDRERDKDPLDSDQAYGSRNSHAHHHHYTRGASTVCGGEPLPAGVPRGLVNLGNTCYMNASLEALYAIEPFRKLVVSISGMALTSGGDRSLTDELAGVFELMQSSDEPVSVANFKYAFSRYQSKFCGFGQQDAQEFLRYLVNGIHEEHNKAPRRHRTSGRGSTAAPGSAAEAWQQYRDIVDDSPLVDLLVGQLCSTIECSVCHNKSHCWDPFWDLSLALQQSATTGNGPSSAWSSAGSSAGGYSTGSTGHGSSSRYGASSSSYSTTRSLARVLDDFTSAETLDYDERPTCERCKKPTRSSKQISVCKAPKVMILHLKKFTNDGYKLSSPEVRIDQRLTIHGSGGSGSIAQHYELSACISHHGHSSTSGHYTSHCKYSSKWFHFNDDRVKDVTSSFDANKLNDAYVLIYTAS